MTKVAEIEVIKPKQSNYDTYFVPEEVKDKAHVPLYRLVSYWGMRKQKYICRDDIATAFGISLRQASGLISAIYRKHDEIICSVKRIKSGKGNIVKSYILISDILVKNKKRRVSNPTVHMARSIREKKNQQRGETLWSHILSRPSKLHSDIEEPVQPIS